MTEKRDFQGEVLAKALTASIFAALLVASFPCLSPAYTSPNVPLDHWSYEAIERLAASGTVHTIMLNRRPLTRMEMAGILSKIPKAIPVTSPVLKEDIRRLTEEYRDELIRLGTVAEAGRPGWYRIADPISYEMVYADIGDLRRTPRENHWGEYFYDGMTNQIFIRAWANLSEDIVIDIAPKLRIKGDGYNAIFQEAYIKASISNIALEAGRDSIWWGPGYHGSLILSNNALPFNLVRIGSQRPFPLPWWFSILGLWDISAFLTQLEDNRDFPGAKLFGMRVGLIPAKFMELSLTRSIIFSGEGRPELDLSDYMKIFFAIGENEPGKLDNDQLGGLDIRIAVPVKRIAEGLSIYGQLIGEDEAGGLPSSPGILYGVFMPDLFNMGLFDLRVEYAEQPVLEGDSPRYIHSIYTKGYTYHSRVIGHPMGIFEDDYFTNGVFGGVDAWDIFYRATVHIGQDIDIGLQYDYERHRASATADEIKKEGVIDISWRMRDNILLKLGQEYEKVNNWRGSMGQDLDNYYLWSKVEVDY